MGLKFRRGTTAQKSGSLAFGEPYVNTTLGTLQIGGQTGDITLGASGTGSQGSFAGISGSSLDITGNAKIDGNLTLGGNITIGDNTSDTVAMTANLSSSIIPSLTNTFDLGSPSKQWRHLYISTGSLYMNGTAILSSNATELTLTTDAGQSLKILETAADTITLQTAEGNIALNSTGAGDVILDPNTGVIALKGTTTLYAGNKILSSDGNAIQFGNNVAITGSLITTTGLTVGGDFVVNGTTTTIDSTNINIGDNIIVLNGTLTTNGGMYVKDAAGASTLTGSMLWDTTNDRWIAGAKGSELAILRVGGDSVVSGSSQITYASISSIPAGIVSGSSQTIVNLPTGTVSGSSQVDATATTNFATGVKTQLNSNTVVSGSSQITYASISSIPAGIVSGSTQVIGILSSLNTYTGSNDITNTAQNTRLTTIESVTGSYETKGRGIVSGSSQVTPLLPTGVVSGSAQTIANLPTGTISGSSQVTYASISSIPAGIISGSSQLSGTTITNLTITNLTTVNQTASVVFSSGSNRFGDFGDDVHDFTGSVKISGSITTIGASTATSFNGTINATNGVVSGSSQISHDSTTGFVANKHIDHTSVLISAGNGLSGGGDISSTRTLTLDSGSTHFTNGVKTTLNTNTVISGSSQVTGILNAQLTNSTISGISLGSNLATLTISTGLSGTSYNGSGAITIANTGVTSNVAGTGITVSGATGAVTITNAGVTSAVAGTGVTVSGATGAVTVSIGQAVGTTSTPTFGNLTINGTVTATGDITAFFTSDIRHKNNVQLIDNALDKVNALNGVTWEWNDDVDEVTKTTPKTGLIAQDVLDVLPEVVKTRENGFLALDYSKMVGLLVEAIKEQDIVIQKLKSDMVGLSTTITVFEDRMKEKGLL